MKKAIKYIKRVIFIILAFIVIYLLAAFVLSYSGTNPSPLACKKSEKLYITTTGIHLFIILPKENLDSQLLAQLAIPKAIKFISFGWGDKEFYLNTPTWDDMDLRTTLNALFWSSESAMQVSHYTNTHNSWEELNICPDQVNELNNFIIKSFKKDKAGSVIKIEAVGYGEHDYFYEAKGRYSCFYTCNNWVNQALKNVQIKTSIWSPFDVGVMYHIKEQ